MQPVTETRGFRKKKSGGPVTSVYNNPPRRSPNFTTSRSFRVRPHALPPSLVQAVARSTKPFCLRGEQSSLSLPLLQFVSNRFESPLDSLEIDGPGIITFSRTVCRCHAASHTAVTKLMSLFRITFHGRGVLPRSLIALPSTSGRVPLEGTRQAFD